MEVLNNYVVVKPDDDYTSKGMFVVSDDFEPMYHVAITGTVEDVCRELYFQKEKMSSSEVQSRKNQIIHARSVEYDVDVEVSAGDKVWYRYTVWTDPKNIYDGLLVFKYDQLYAKEINGVLIPVNGWIFVKEIESGVGEVCAVGNPVRQYLYHKDGDYPMPKVGDVIGYDKSSAARIEFQLWESHGYKRIQAKDVIWLKK